MYIALRLYPQLALNLRFATKTTILPRGGGLDGQSPVLIPKGAGVGWSTYHLHRLESIYGPDAKVYRPQRWESGGLIKTARLGAGFIDFNGGSRVCLGSALFKLSKFILMLTACRGFCYHGSKLHDNKNTTSVSGHLSSTRCSE
jgi:cytochrome P450